MQIDLALQAFKLEQILDKLHDEISEELGETHQISNRVMQCSARAFALFCDLTDYEDRKSDENEV